MPMLFTLVLVFHVGFGTAAVQIPMPSMAKCEQQAKKQETLKSLSLWSCISQEPLP